MRDVAVEARVSIMTVSRVLRKDSNVAEETRSRVLTAAKLLDYQPNEAARNLRLGLDDGLVGLVVADLANPFYSQLALGVEATLAENGLRLLIASSGESAREEEHLVSDFVSRRVVGLIITPAVKNQPPFRTFAVSHTPLVLTGTPPSRNNADCVLVDDFGGSLMATRRLIDFGHRSIAYFGGPPTAYTGAERFRGFSTALIDGSVASSARLVRQTQDDVAGWEKASRELLSTSKAPSAVFCANNRIALGVMRAATSLGVLITVVCFDDFEMADLTSFPLIIVSFDANLLGRHSAQLLLNQIDHPYEQDDLARKRIVIPTAIVERNI